MTVSAARSRFADVIEETRLSGRPTYLTRHQRPVAAIIDAEQLDRLIEAAEDLADLQAAQAARIEMAAGAAPVPWDEVKRDLGLT
ncbi:MAG: type II toxin-antitoxin system Phd/YefM family antitoxin [Propionibacteriaceae bacterium]|jgi:prevent-host-death family protein|nr:type II toxin-antitoxin system Phd/YefM family antitoxin [Propionibacteriaceae bacterium]